jgi:Fur family ferric uptake transcriptional regulator
MQASNLRLTPARRAVIEVIEQHAERLNPEEIAAECQAGRATVYRLLKTMTDLGLLCRVIPDQGASFYHLSPHARRHHLICRRCDALCEIEGGGLDNALSTALASSGYTDVNFRVEASGLCPLCQSS